MIWEHALSMLREMVTRLAVRKFIKETIGSSNSGAQADTGDEEEVERAQ